ncbi:hypothetical protein CLV59_104175 [Chitinophaga dinghuensis]|uniref:Fimbrillin-A associated anchor protein Mfa1/Mfa2 n=1 Tax=Chitinophaga dinghuensis TaxID=1539050 RepID=A0A327W0P5_9BACT|nr:hypothetical protein [Chitinophaga dinghuensis]RAJ81950.1 hypothetical protein CLV59_104175 [Chitinophaga dinghuensis]
MKTPKALVLGSLVLMSVLYACKKNDNAPVPENANNKWSGETMNVKLKFSGDLQVEASPLGRQASNARTTPENTIYAVDVRWSDYKPYAQGLFTSIDSINLNLPKGAFFKIRVAAIKKGSSLGLYESDGPMGYGRFLSGPGLDRYITDRMSTDSVGPYALQYGFLDTLSNFVVATNYGYEMKKYSELDTYYGTYQGAPQDSQATSITIPLKRLTYGIRFKPQNFTDGKLLVDYDYYAASKTLEIKNLADTFFTYTAHEFTFSSNLQYGLPVRLKWQRSNGNIQNIGNVTIYPARNTMTTLSVTAPNNGIPLGISISENNWNFDTTIVVR